MTNWRGSSGAYRSKLLSRARWSAATCPAFGTRGLNGGNLYYDGQFDDTRLAIALARTAVSMAAELRPIRESRPNSQGVQKGRRGRRGAGRGHGKTTRDPRPRRHQRHRRLRGQDPPIDKPHSEPIVSASQGTHLVFKRSFWTSDHAMVTPARTTAGCVCHSVAWSLLVGTTDVQSRTGQPEAAPSNQEIDFIPSGPPRPLPGAQRPRGSDVLSTYAGLRPLVRPPKGADSTAAISRDHSILISKSGLVTVTGGKWTTCRKMGEDTITRAAETGGLKPAPCRTVDFRLVPDAPRPIGEMLHPALEYDFGDVDRGVREESAQTLEDVLARRTRCLFLNSGAAREMPPAVADRMAKLLGRDEAWAAQQVAEFEEVARRYQCFAFGVLRGACETQF